MDRESLFIAPSDPNTLAGDGDDAGLVASDPRDVRIAKLEAEAEELKRKLRMARQLLIKLDARLKAAAPASLPPQPCPVCGAGGGGGSVSAAAAGAEQGVLARVEQDLQQSRASRRPPPSPRTAPLPAAARKRPGPIRLPSASSVPRCHLSQLPFRAVFVLFERLGRAGGRALAQTGREWAGLARAYVRQATATRLALCLYDDERVYRGQLDHLRAYREGLLRAGALQEADAASMFANVDTLVQLSDLLLRDLHGRFADWKPGDSVADAVVTIMLQGMRLFGVYYANHEVVLPDVMARLSMGPDLTRVAAQLRGRLRAAPLAQSLQAPLHRVAQLRALVPMMRQAAVPGSADAQLLQRAAVALDEAVAAMNEARKAQESVVALSRALASVRDLPALRTHAGHPELRLLLDVEVVRVARGKRRPYRLILLSTGLVCATPVSRLTSSSSSSSASSSNGNTWRFDRMLDPVHLCTAERAPSVAVVVTGPDDKVFTFQLHSDAAADGLVRAMRDPALQQLADAAPPPPLPPDRKGSFLTRTLGRSAGSGGK